MVKYILTGVLSAASVAGSGYTFVSGLQSKVAGLEAQNSQYAKALNTKNDSIDVAIKALESARVAK